MRINQAMRHSMKNSTGYFFNVTIVCTNSPSFARGSARKGEGVRALANVFIELPPSQAFVSAPCPSRESSIYLQQNIKGKNCRRIQNNYGN
jgi:hypothetical protein